MPDMKIVYRNPADLKPAEYNPRQLTEKEYADLKASLTSPGGFAVPILVNKHKTRMDIIVGGHQRVKVAIDLGITTVPTVETKLTLKKERELNIRLNKNNGSWDWDMMANHFEMDELKEWGFEEDEILWDIGGGAGGENPPEPPTPEPPKKPKTKPGDIYQLGSHWLICGDATSPDVVKKLMGDQKADIMVTDPPYGVEYDPAWRKAAGINDSNRMGTVANDDKCDWREAWALFEGDVAYVWHAGLKTAQVLDSLEHVGFEPKSQIIWNKGRPCIGRSHYHWAHEPAWFLVRKGKKANWASDRKQTTIWDIPMVNNTNQDEATEHGTQKPLECMLRPIRHHKGEIVYDPFGGSGTTLIAADMLDRQCRMVELDPGYCDVIVQRYCSLKDLDPKKAFKEKKIQCIGGGIGRR